MGLDTRVAAFTEYVLRPMTADILQILEQLRSLNIGLTQDTIKQLTLTLGLWHLLGELIRACSYLAVTWIICQSILELWPLL